jgi:hypothetical protein
MNTYRLVICVDVEADTLTEAYGDVYRGMTKSALDWESSDEWFDVDGYHGDPDVLQTARMAYLDKVGLDGNPPSEGK